MSKRDDYRHNRGNVDGDNEKAVNYTIDLSVHGLEQTVSEELEMRMLCLSQLSPDRFDNPRMMKLIGSIFDYKVFTMMNSGANHYFISSRVAQHLNLTVDTSQRSTMTLGNGQ